MPLARILTRFPQHAGALSEELRRRGYSVEFSSPELAGKAPADLEIDFEICPEPDALSRASELAEQLHADVAVSPGAVQYADERAPDPIANVALQSSPEVEPRGAGPVSAFSADEPAGAFARDAEEALPDSAESILAELGLGNSAVPQATQQSDLHFESRQRAEAAFDDELEIARAAAQDDTAFGQEPELAAPVPSGTASQTVREWTVRVGEKTSAALQASAGAAGTLWASARHWTREWWAAARHHSQEYSGRFEVRKAEMRAERQQKLLELEKRRALAHERATELEAAREAAAARLQELLRERGGLTEAQPVPPQKVSTAAPTSSPVRLRLFSRGIFLRKLRLPLLRSYRPQLEPVMVGIAAACLLFVVGLAVASFHTRPAISTTLTPPQPATGVTVESGGVTVKAGSAGATVTPNPARPSPVVRAQSTAKPGAAVHQAYGSDVTVRSFPAAKPASSSGANRASDDVTIRHFGSPANPPAQTAPHAQLKHYSDLDN